MNILIISDRFFEYLKERKDIKIYRWDERFSSFMGSNHAIIIDFSFIDKQRLLEIKDNINFLKNNLLKENIINQDNLIVIVVCGSSNEEYDYKDTYDENNPELDDFTEDRYIKENSYNFLSQIIPDFKRRVEFFEKEKNYEPLSIKYISVLQYLDIASNYYMIFRYDPDSPDCSNIYPLVKAKKTGNACVAFENRIGKGILIVLPGYDQDRAEDACFTLLKVCRNYFKVREDYDELMLNIEVPKEIKEDYIEALVCFLNDLYKASCILSGSALETSLELIGAKGGKLFKKIDFLANAGLLYKKTKILAEKIRKFRNEAAHFNLTRNISINEDDAKNMLLFLRQFLNDIQPIEETKGKVKNIIEGGL
jgi:hypothetical protein